MAGSPPGSKDMTENSFLTEVFCTAICMDGLPESWRFGLCIQKGHRCVKRFRGKKHTKLYVRV